MTTPWPYYTEEITLHYINNRRKETVGKGKEKEEIVIDCNMNRPK